jgi:hypothetical protein
MRSQQAYGIPDTGNPGDGRLIVDNSKHVFKPNNLGTTTDYYCRYFFVGNIAFVHLEFTVGTGAANPMSVSLPPGWILAKELIATTQGQSPIGIWYNIAPSGTIRTFAADVSGVVFYDGSDVSKLFITGQGASGSLVKVNGSTVSSYRLVLELQLPLTFKQN